MRIPTLLVLLLMAFSSFGFTEDGTYDAVVTTDSGSYTVPVEVEDGEVTHVDWPNGGRMTVDGAELQDGEADGINSRGASVHIDLDDPQDAVDEVSDEGNDE